MNAKTDWLSPARQTTGLDHLAAQAVSERLYTELLPAITNVTDRIRCYTFYPWFVAAFDEHSTKKDADTLVMAFRRADCLHTLIGICHELEKDDEWIHGGGLTGRNTLRAVGVRILDGETIRLSTYATTDDVDTRYFKHRLGGLGQYYLGPLRDLEILDGNARSGLRYTTDWGARLASCFGETVDTQSFFRAIDSDQVDSSVIRSMYAFCPCNLARNQAERDALVELLFCTGVAPFAQEHGAERRQTLLLLLAYAERIRTIPGATLDADGFLSASYTGALPDGSPWQVDDALSLCARGWGLYLRHELLSVSVQGLFWAGLTALLQEGGRTRDITSYGQWFASRFQAALGSSFARRSLAGVMSSTRDSSPSLSDWQSERHEISLAHQILEAQKQDDADAVVKASLDTLLALSARTYPVSGYGHLDLSPAYLASYEINLVALDRHASTTWSEMNGRAWLEWLAAIWNVRVHLRVALRKLRHQSEDTFRIVPLDDGLWVREVPEAQWSSPRLTTALRVLHDLGALSMGDQDDEPYELTQFGESLLERARGED